jgi:hypothetical protein
MQVEHTKGGQPGDSNIPNDTDEVIDNDPSQNSDPYADKFERLERTLNTVVSGLQSQAQRFNEFQTQLTTPKKPQRTKEQLSELYEQDPLSATTEVVSDLLDQKLSRHTTQMTVETQKMQWDSKAKSDFPVNDQKFMDEMNVVWREMAEDGYDLTHPKALYRCAKETATRVGAKKAAPKKDKDGEFSDAEPPRGGTPSSSSSKTTVRDDDPRVAFYKMRPGVTPKKIEEYKKELAERDKAKKGSK